MSWDRIEGQWKQRRGKATHHWGMMMNDELAMIAGKYGEFVGRLQEKYGIANEETKQQIDDFKSTLEHLKKTHTKLVEAQKKLSKQKKLDRKPEKSKTPARKKTRSKTNG
jgi:uncharacterized protein YjbJ (UPF0337 family)